TGTVVLASTVERDLLSATPKRLTPERRREARATRLTVLGLQGAAAVNLVDRMTSEREYVVLQRELTPEQSARIRELSSGDDRALAGLALEPQASRGYPQR